MEESGGAVKACSRQQEPQKANTLKESHPNHVQQQFRKQAPNERPDRAGNTKQHQTKRPYRETCCRTGVVQPEKQGEQITQPNNLATEPAQDTVYSIIQTAAVPHHTQICTKINLS